MGKLWLVSKRGAVIEVFHSEALALYFVAGDRSYQIEMVSL